MKLQVSFVVLTHNSEKMLEKCLLLIKMQKVAKEIIIVDGNSTDNTIKIANEYADVVVRGFTNLAKARNAGIELSKGRLIAFVDSDILLTPDWTTSMIELFRVYSKTNQIASVSCEFKSMPRNYVTKSLDELRQIQHKGTVVKNSGFMQSSLWSSKVLKKLRIDLKWEKAGEDLDLFWKANKLGYGHLVTDSSIVWHYGVKDLDDVTKKWARYGVIHQKIAREIPTQRSKLNMFKLWYFPVLVVLYSISVFTYATLPLFLLWFFVPDLMYGGLLLIRKKKLGLSFVFVNGVKFKFHSLGMMIAMVKNIMRH